MIMSFNFLILSYPHYRLYVIAKLTIKFAIFAIIDCCHNKYSESIFINSHHKAYKFSGSIEIIYAILKQKF